MSVREIDASGLHEALLKVGDGKHELAVLDVREEGVFGTRHLLRAVNIPLSRFEILIRKLVPRPTTPIVLIDDADGLTERMSDLLDFAGYTDVSVLKGGVDAWEKSGYELFSGVNVPSKVFGEFIEHRFGTPHLSAGELKARLDAGENIVVLDSRPMSEYRTMNIPTGIDVPGAELVHRVKTLVHDPETTVVVNCAGRTRSIIGAQSLRNAGLENPVYALKNGTMGWHLAGLDLEYGQERQAPEPDEEGRAWAEAASAKVAERFGVQSIDPASLKNMLTDADRTTFILDVREREEFEVRHLKGATHAPGGQLVQATDRYVGTLGARLVLYDDFDVRARMTASWLIQMGWPEVYVLTDPFDGTLETATGPSISHIPEMDLFAQSFISAIDLAALADVPVIDLSTSLQHKRGHVPGARFAIRSTIMRDIAPLAPARMLVLTAHDERIARLGANDLTRNGIHRVRVLRDGLDAWKAEGLPVETGMTNPLSDPALDVYERPYDLDDGVEAAMQAYLDWEIALIEQIERDGTLKFPDFPA